MLKQFAKLIVNFPKATLTAVMVLTLYIGFGIGKLETRNNYDSDLPKNDPIIITNDRFKKVFGDKDVVMIGIRTADIFNRQTLQKIALISEELKNVKGIIEDQIFSLSTLNNIKGRDWGLEVGDRKSVV